MATFLDDLSIYNATAATAITLAATRGDSGRANLMSSLKSTANDTSLTEAVRLNALTALINVGDLLDIPLPPYFPSTTTFANSQTYTGLHNDLIGLDVEPYLHLTTAEKSFYANKANLGDISFANLVDAYTANLGLDNAINGKQDALNGTGFVKASGGTITYDNSTYLTSISGIAAGGGLDGTYPNPTLRNTSVTGQLLTGFNVSAPTGSVTGSNTILSALQTLNANINNVIATAGTISSISFSLPSSVFTFTAGPFTSGAANLSGTFNNQSQNRFFAGPLSGGAGQPSFRVISPGDLPVSGATANTYGSASSIPVLTVDVYGRITSIANVTAASGGQVNTITYAVPAGVFTQTVVGTSAVAITLGLSTQTAATVWAGPVSGAAATPGFRALASTDIPNIGITQVSGLQATLDGFLTTSLSDGSIWIGNTSNAPVQRVLSGDVTVTNEGVTAIGLAKVQYDMIQDVTAQTLLGRYNALDGEVQQVTLSADFLLDSISGELSLSSPVSPVVTTKGDLLGHDLTVQQRVPSNNIDGSILLVNNSATGAYTNLGLNWVAMSGDATIAASGAITIAAGAVSLAKMANLAANSFIGNNTGSAATPIALTATQATAMLNQFTTSLKGLTPASGGVGATYYLNATGGWSIPAGGGGGSGTVTSANQYSIPYYSVNPTGTTVIGLAPQTTNGIYFLRANVTASAAVAPDWIGSTGTGNVVLATSPTLVTPTLGAALATSINGLTISTTTGTLTLDNGSTLATSGAFSTTLTATATTTLTLPTTGTLATLAGTETFTNKTLNSPKIGSTGGQGHFHMHSTNSVPTGLADYITVFGDKSPNKKVGFLFETDAFESYFQFNATTASKTYTFPDLSGTVALLANPAAFTSITTGTASSLDGDVIFQNASNANTQTLKGSAVASSIVYVLPTTAPTAGQVLSAGLPAGSPLVSALSWTTIAGGGDVVGPVASVTDGNFAVFGATGQIIKESVGASLSAAGAAVFNTSVTVGVSGTTTGQLIFRNATTGATTTLQASTSQSANLIYTWPTSTPAAGNILSSDAGGNLSWTAPGAGDMVLATAGQIVTGSKIYSDTTLLLRNPAQTFSTTLSAGVSTAARTITFPNLSGTVALLDNIQIFTGAKTFRAAVTIGDATYTAANLLMGGTVSNFIKFNTSGTGIPVPNFDNPPVGTKIVIFPSQNVSTTDAAIGFSQANSEMWLSTVGGAAGKVSFYGSTTRLGFWGASGTNNGLFVGDGSTAGFLQMNSTTSNLIYYVDGGAALPSVTTTRSLGSKIVIKQALATGSTDYAIGYNTSTFWCSVPSGGSFIWYGNATPVLTLTGGGALTIAGAIVGIASQDIFNTVSTTVNFAGAATTLAIGNVATAAQTVNMFTASTGASTYNFATGATASATTKAINIGTGGAAGSTTNITLGTSTTTNLRFFGSANTSGKPTVTGSKVSGAALASLLTAMSNLGLITDSTTA